ncbi:MAG: HEPN domain-containing protein [Deltaproteobacteria bacterium]|nr:HEPN domain-containing protein [Deltaproteobacteria bacterium]
MSAPPEIIAEVRRWVEKADNDFRNAEFVLTMDRNCPFDTVAYHCQQCAEKYLKALLVYWNVDFPRTHDLVVLFNLLRDTTPVELSLEDVQPLNRYSIEARYPGAWDPVEEAEAKAALLMARKVRVTVRSILHPALERGPV